MDRYRIANLKAARKGDIIPGSARDSGRPAWRELFARAVSDPDELARRIGFAGGVPGFSGAAARDFSLRAPGDFLARIGGGDPLDPLLLQVLPRVAETRRVEGFVADPVGDAGACLSPGLLQKYRGRALLVVTGACAIHCRYCFRRHFPYGEHALAAGDMATAIRAIDADPSISEVILSGGDPLSLPDDKLAGILERLESVPHLTRLRIHTRLPVVIPSRVDDHLLSWLGNTRFRTVVVLHVNHAQELGPDARQAIARLAGVCGTILNQSVLLRAVNDSVEALYRLSEALFESGVLPYYLHLLDRVHGAAHFEVPEDEAIRLVDELKARLPGYLVPRLVREIPGAVSKVGVGGPHAHE